MTSFGRAGHAGAVLVLVAGLSACTGGSSDAAQRAAAKTFLSAVGAGSAVRAAAATSDPTVALPALQRSVDGLGTGARAAFELRTVTTKGTRAKVGYTARWTLPASPKRWTYRGAVALRQAKGRWRVDWRPTDLHPQLSTGSHLQVRTTAAARASLLDGSGKALFTRTPVVTVGIEPKLATRLDALATTLAGIPVLQSTRAEIVAAARAARPTDFVPIITLRRAAYERIRAMIYNLPGTVFHAGTQLLGPTARFGQPLLGTVGEATPEIAGGSKGRIAAGEPTGIGGLQQAYDRQLAGTPAVTVFAAPDTNATAGRVLATVDAGAAGTPVRITLSRTLQTAAETALGSVRKPAAIVAVQRSTGRILADANTGATTYDYALSGAFPPGSTFKIATWTAAFTADPQLTPSAKVACPSSTTVDGRTFVNENRFSHPPVTVAAAFGYSCNTSAIATALKLPSTALADAAHTLGLGAKWSLPVPAFSGSIPAPVSTTERAADAIGQGRVLASPLLLALMASAADGGPVLAPSLSASAKAATGTRLPATLAAEMAKLLTATVALPGGTGHDLDGLGSVVGKTGTAEYGNAKPPRSHSWFAGVRGDVAFAVFVYDGATTHVDAVPITRAFLRAAG